MNRKLRVLLMLTLVVALLFVAACGGAGGSDNDTGEDTGNDAGDDTGDDTSGETIELGVTWWGPDERHEATQAALDLYTEKNPNITFTAEPVAWDGFWDRLPTLAAAGTVPDILQMDAAFIDEYVSRGVLADLTGLELEDVIDPRILENVKINDKLYGVPLSHNAQGFAYHAPTVEDYGLTEPTKGWSWDDYFAFAEEAREKLPEDKWGISDSTTWDGYQYYQTSHDKGPVFETAEDGTKTYNLDKDTWTEWMEIHQDYRERNVVPPPDIGHVENDPIADPMASGDVVLIGKSVGSVSALEVLMPGEVKVVNVPVGPSGKGGWAQSTIFLSAAENTPHLDEIKDFMRWFVSDMEAGEILGTTRGIPINDAVYEMIEPTLERKDTIGKDLLDACIDYALPFYPLAAGWQEWLTTYEAEVEAIQFGQQTIEEAYENLADLAEQLEADNQ